MAENKPAPPARPAPQAGPTPRPRPRLGLTIDRALAGGGVAAAFFSFAFAGYMVADRGRQPHFAGQQYLAIFAKPRRPSPPAPSAPVLARAEAPSGPSGIDPTPTGSISAPRSANPASPAAPLPPSSYRLVAATPGHAWIESETGYRQVKPGDVLPGLGRIEAIEERDGQWVALTENGQAIGSGDEGPPAQAADTRFKRRMIFDAGGK